MTLTILWVASWYEPRGTPFAILAAGVYGLSYAMLLTFLDAGHHHRLTCPHLELALRSSVEIHWRLASRCNCSQKHDSQECAAHRVKNPPSFSHDQAGLNFKEPGGDQTYRGNRSLLNSNSDCLRTLVGCSESLLEQLLQLCPALLQQLLALDYQSLVSLQSANHKLQRLVRQSVTHLRPVRFTLQRQNCISTADM